MSLRPVLAVPLLALLAGAARAQVPPPPHIDPLPEKPAEEQPAEDETAFTLPAIEIVGEPQPLLREEERVGSYGQPRWTARRRFPTTRVYVVPEGEVGAEYWMRVDERRPGEKDKIRHFYEVEWGLGHRLQLDVYAKAVHEGKWDFTDINEQSLELRWALADWDELWGNPTLYFEAINVESGADVLEAKLLLGGEAASGWHWGTNFVLEQETGDERERTLELTAGLSHTMVDSLWSLGGELKAASIDTKGHRGENEWEYYAGPSLQWLPNERTHVDLAPLVGFGPDANDAQILLVVGYEF